MLNSRLIVLTYYSEHRLEAKSSLIKVKNLYFFLPKSLFLRAECANIVCMKFSLN